MSLFNAKFSGHKTVIDSILSSSLNISKTPVGGQLDVAYVDGTTIVDLGDNHKGIIKLTAGAPFALNPGDMVQVQVDVSKRELFDPIQHLMVFKWGPSGIAGVSPCVEQYIGVNGVTTQIQFTHLGTGIYNSADLYFQYLII